MIPTSSSKMTHTLAPSRVSFLSTLQMLSPMIDRYLPEYDLYPLCAISHEMNRLVINELEKMHQRRRAEDEKQREEIRAQLATIDALRAKNSTDTQNAVDSALMLDSNTSSSSLTPEILEQLRTLILEQGAFLPSHSDGEHTYTLYQIVQDDVSEFITLSEGDARQKDVRQEYLTIVQRTFSYLQLCLLSNPLLWLSHSDMYVNEQYFGNLLSSTLSIILNGIDLRSQRDRFRPIVNIEVLEEYDKFGRWLIHLLEVRHVMNGGRTTTSTIPPVQQQEAGAEAGNAVDVDGDANVNTSPQQDSDLQLSHTTFLSLSDLSLDGDDPFTKGSEERKRWYQMQRNLLRRAEESCINPPLEHLTDPTHPLYQGQRLIHDDSGLEYVSSILRSASSARVDLIVILCAFPHFQARFRIALERGYTNRAKMNYASTDMHRKKWIGQQLGGENGRKKMKEMIQRFHGAVRSGYVEEVRGKLDVWLGKGQTEVSETKEEKDPEESKSPLSSTSASSSATSSSSQWYSLLFDPTCDSILRRCLISVYFDFISAKETKLIRQIHACIHPLHSAELRDPKTGLSPLHYYLTEITSMPAFRLFDELACEAVRYHRGNVTAALDECSSSGVSIRQLLGKSHVELRVRFFDAHSEQSSV